MLIASGCASYPKGINPVGKNKTDPYGATMKVSPKSTKTIIGELIAVNGDSLYLLGANNQIMRYHIKDIRTYVVYYGTPERTLGWTYALLPAISISHGFWMILSIPINLIFAGGITNDVKQDMIYTNRELPIDKLSIMARFPQGLPPSVSLNEITR